MSFPIPRSATRDMSQNREAHATAIPQEAHKRVLALVEHIAKGVRNSYLTYRSRPRPGYAFSHLTPTVKVSKSAESSIHLRPSGRSAEFGPRGSVRVKLPDQAEEQRSTVACLPGCCKNIVRNCGNSFSPRHGRVPNVPLRFTRDSREHQVPPPDADSERTGNWQRGQTGLPHPHRPFRPKLSLRTLTGRQYGFTRWLSR